MDQRPDYDVIVIGAGAAGMKCAVEAGKRGRRALVIDHAKAAGEKIRISGGGRCNFTNRQVGAENFISENPRFCLSALRRHTPADTIAWLEGAGIAWHEKTLGQLFCDGSARAVVDLLLGELRRYGVALWLETAVTNVEAQAGGGYAVTVGAQVVRCGSLVVATGGKSIPKMGASGFGYDLAARFGLRVTPTRPALVALTIEAAALARLAPLAGVSADVRVTCGEARFAEAMLFTHRGLSGPAILQISSYWREGEAITVDMAPGAALFDDLRARRAAEGRSSLAAALSVHLPKRLAQKIAEDHDATGPLAALSDAALRRIEATVKAWRFKPVGSEGYRTAEVTLGGVDTAELDQRTFEARRAPGLYFIGEVVDVTGWLGGYNFQWAWASGWAAGQGV